MLKSVFAFVLLVCTICLLRAEPPQLPPTPAPRPVDGVKGTVIRPWLGKAKVNGSKISDPGLYTAKTGDAIELEYQYAPLGKDPKAEAQKVAVKVSTGGAITASDLGVRFVEDGFVAQRKLVFFFVAKKAGKDTVTIDIDGNEYEYKFEVSDEQK